MRPDARINESQDTKFARKRGLSMASGSLESCRPGARSLLSLPPYPSLTPTSLGLLEADVGVPSSPQEGRHVGQRPEARFFVLFVGNWRAGCTRPQCRRQAWLDGRSMY